MNPECNPFDYVPQHHNAPGLVQAAFPHEIPTPNQAGAENLRRFVIRYLHHPDAQVGMVSMEAGPAGRFKVAWYFLKPLFIAAFADICFFVFVRSRFVPCLSCRVSLLPIFPSISYVLHRHLEQS